MDAEFVRRVRLAVLDATIESGSVPDAEDVAARLGCSADRSREAFRRLAETHVYVLEPDNPGRLRMANPFSAVPTPFSVEAAGHEYYGNCIWDALGVVSLLGGDGTVRTACPDCGDELTLEISRGHLSPSEGVVHFGVPARHWWDDIIHT